MSWLKTAFLKVILLHQKRKYQSDPIWILLTAVKKGKWIANLCLYTTQYSNTGLFMTSTEIRKKMK